MNTPTHMLMGAVLFGGRRAAQKIRFRMALVAAAGGLVPDIPAIVLVLVARYVNGASFHDIFREYYFSDSWQAIMAPSHSFVVWTLVLAAGIVLSSQLTRIFAASVLVHSACDFLLHVDDPHRHFWPLGNWRFSSPVSYWDPAHYGNHFMPFEIALATVLALILFYRFRSPMARISLAAIVVIYGAQMALFLMGFGH